MKEQKIVYFHKDYTCGSYDGSELEEFQAYLKDGWLAKQISSVMNDSCYSTLFVLFEREVKE